MNYLVIYRKSDGAISRLITKGQRFKISLVSLGFNPILYDQLSVVSSERIDPSKWCVQNGKLVRLISKQDELLCPFRNKPFEEEGQKIIFVGDLPSSNTGFGTQYKILKEGLERKGYVIEQIRYPNIPQLIDMEADFVFVLSDYGSIQAIFDLKLDNLIYWFALESSDWPSEWNEKLKKVSHIVPITRYGQRALLEKGISCNNPIPHGVDPDIFRPLPIRQRGLLRKQNEVENRFVISYIGTNVQRKRLDLLIRCFAKFVKETDEDKQSVLILKTKVNGHYDISREIEVASSFYEVSNLVDQVKIVEKEMSPSEISQIINISDLGFNTTSGEGFCIPVIEYLMCGVPFLAGRHTSFIELLSTNLPLISVEDVEIDNRFRWTRYNIDVDHAVQILDQYFKNWKNNRSYLRQRLREIALGYSSSLIVNMWDEYFRVAEREKIEQQLVEKAATALLGIKEDTKKQQIYERASRAVENTSTNSEVTWIKVF